jgi:hypothetical protein
VNDRLRKETVIVFESTLGILTRRIILRNRQKAFESYVENLFGVVRTRIAELDSTKTVLDLARFNSRVNSR